MKLAQKLVELARKELGVEEVDGTNTGKRVNEYKAATDLDPRQSWPWCAAFICWLVREAMLALGGNFTFQPPTTAAAWRFEEWSRRQDDSTWLKKPSGTDVQAGDIVVFTFSHIGIAISDPDTLGFVTTIEGNTDHAGSREGGGVYQKKRHIGKIRSRIRFRV
jgi:hypothetical protein